MAATQDIFLLTELKKWRKKQLQKFVKIYAMVWGKYTNMAGIKPDEGDVTLLQIFDLRFNTRHII